jgi:hypothetical protein
VSDNKYINKEKKNKIKKYTDGHKYFKTTKKKQRKETLHPKLCVV